MFIVVKKITVDDEEYCTNTPLYFVIECCKLLKSISTIPYCPNIYIQNEDIDYLKKLGCRIVKTNKFKHLTNH